MQAKENKITKILAILEKNDIEPTNTLLLELLARVEGLDF